MKNLLIDGNSLINRAFYALPILSTDEGVYTNAVYGFLKMMYKAIDEYAPDRVICAFDLKKPTFRHLRYKDYKAGRKKMPEELVPQIPLLKEILNKLGVLCVEKEGYEADDIIGTFASLGDREGDSTVIITGDRDSFQLITDKTGVWFTKKGISDILQLTPENLKENYGVEPGQVCDLKALMGDSSDNIPGVAGIGEKTAISLIEQFGSLDGLYEHTDELKGKQQEKIINGKESAYESKFLVTICREVPGISFDGYLYVPADNSVSAEIFKKYQFKSLLERVGATEETYSFETREFDEFSFSGDTLAIYFDENEIFLATDRKCQYRISISFDLLSMGMSKEDAISYLAPILKDEKVKKYFYDSKSAMHFFGEINNIKWDVMLAEYLIDAGNDGAGIENIQKRYNCQISACSLLYISEKQFKTLEKRNLLDLYFDMEMPLAKVLFTMEKNGFYVNTDILRNLGNEFSKRIDSISREIFALADREFNINSPYQLADALTGMGITLTKKTHRGYSTDNDVLESIDHPIAPLIIEYRQMQKLKSTYVDGVYELVSPKTGRIHTTFKQAVTSTGRLSSTEPNLQNIPVRYESGRNIRKAFMPEKEGYVLVNGDYSQIELRVLAHLSNDETLVKAFNDNEDIHARTAANVFGIDIKDVTSSQRSRAKAVNFGIIYGISDFGLAKNINSTRREAGEFIEKYFEKYGRIKEYLDSVVAEAKRCGYSLTLMGRRRDIPQIRSQNYNLRSFGERIAMNTPVQGTAADIIKLAMLRVQQKLDENPDLGKLILQVHDELIIEVEEKFAEESAKMLKETMENVVKLNVPLICETNIGRTWFELK